LICVLFRVACGHAVFGVVIGFAWVSTRSLGEVLLRYALVGAAARPLGVCPAHRFA